MARATGVTCDGCGAFAVTADNRLPDGWLTVTVTTPRDRTEGRWELCSNKCLRDLGSARYKAEREEAGEVTTRTITDEGRATMRANGLRMAHENGHHDSDPNPECESCVEATTPQGATR